MTRPRITFFSRILLSTVLILGLLPSQAFAARGSFGDRVWYDLDKDGIQDPTEPGVAGVTVRVGRNTTTTDAQGYWTVGGLRDGRSYNVSFSNLPAGYTFTTPEQGGDDELDSDVNPSTGEAGSWVAANDVNLTNIDAGIILPVPEIDIEGNGVSIFDGDQSASAGDGTYFGNADIVTGTVDHTFVIQNEGDGDLTLSGNPLVQISGGHAADFVVTSQPGNSTLTPASSETFVVRFDPSASGIRSATVTITNDDADEGGYSFSIKGTGTATPEIDIQGNGVSISDGLTSPSVNNGTDFGSEDIYGGANSQSFVITNSGSGTLNLSGSPLVNVSGSHASDFQVTHQPNVSVVTALGGTESFDITFDPSATGLRQATVTLYSDDPDESPYTFNIQGVGTINPEIDIHGNGISIASGSSSPSPGDSTLLGTVNVGEYQLVNYTIYNTGPAALNLTGAWPLIAISGLHSEDFLVNTPPSSSIAPGASSTFQIKFQPLASGTRQATLTLANNDLNEGTYTFDISGTGQYVTAPLSQINLKGNGQTIPNGDATPSSSDGTSLGSVLVDGEQASTTFTIENLGSEDLLLTSTPRVTISGSHAADFAISQQPSSPVAPGGSVTFTVLFDPSDGGTRTAFLSIESNDADLSPYTFSLEGIGLTAPEIEVQGNGLEISSGDASPSMLDSTYFGEVTASLGEATVRFTIYNHGSTSLNLNGSVPVAISGEAQNEYTVTKQPSSSIPAGGSSYFLVSFDPSQVGLRNAAISIISNDSDESPYQFAIQGNGTGPGSPLACVPNFFHVFGDNGTVTYLDASTSPYTYTTIVEAGYSINGTGYNLEDGLLYGFEMDTDVPGDNIIRIDGQGTITVLSSVSIPYNSWRADFNNSGEMYFWNSSGTEISIFDASEGTVTSHTTNGTAWVPIDMVYLDDDGLYYGVHGTTLYIYNPSTHNVSTKAVTGRLADEFSTGINSEYYGAGWSANDGYVYFTNSQSGRMYKINVHSGNAALDAESVWVGQAEANLNKSDGASCPLADAPLPATGSIGDDVWIDSDADGIQDAGEAGLPGITVELYTIDGTFIAAAVSDENGNYQFNNLEPSEYYLEFTGAPAGFSYTLQDVGTNDLIDSDVDASTGRTANFFVSVGGIDEGLDAGFSATGVGDFVWDDLDQDGIQDLGEPGIPGVTVELVLSSNSSTVATTITDANGFYLFSGVTATSYRIRVSNLPGGYSFSPQNSTADASDSDVNTGTGLSDQFTLIAGAFNSSVDAGIYQVTAPEMNITGLGVNILDGDVTPSGSDGTDFGSVLASSGTVVQTFTIENTTGADLSLNGNPVVEIIGTNADDFSVTSLPATTVSSGTSTSFQITFDPSAGGLRVATVSITNNDGNENPYDFVIQGTGLAPEILLKGNGQVIQSGSTIPNVGDQTDLGSADIVTGQVDVTYWIVNEGSTVLDLTSASPFVTISGGHTSDFNILTPPAGTIAAGDSTHFILRFDPTSNGLRTATLSIANTDQNENPYVFDIQGTGTSFPAIAISGNGQNILNGDSSPSTLDLTDFGSRDVNGEETTHTFTIHNNGSGVLDLTSSPHVQIYGVNAGDFVIVSQPTSSSVPAGGTASVSVRFDPTTTGVRTAYISIANSDTDENPYIFYIQGLGTSTLDEEMEILGNDQVILSGDPSPSFVDGTDLGTAEISGIPSSSQFTIRNIGYAVLHLTGPPPYVSIGGTHASEFLVTGIPSNSVGIDSATTSFEISFNPAGLGLRSAVVSIQNDDSDENPYTFTVQGTGIYNPNSLSEINVEGNLISIVDGDNTPALADGTDMGSVEVVGGFTATQEFIVHNLGSEDLVLGSTPVVSLSGSHAADFTITSQAVPLVAPNSTVAFTVSFDPSATGIRQAVVSIGNSDPDENPYNFTIQGTGTVSPAISVSGNGIVINPGDDTPSSFDSTYFGDSDVALGSETVTYTISNTGSSALTFGSPAISVSGNHAADFSVSQNPSTINIGSTSQFSITFDPTVVGSRTATVTIHSNDPDHPAFSFDIQGTGLGAGSPIACAPNFYQVYGNVGVISVLDASTSPYTYTTIATAGYEIDGIGYNQQDGLIYGFEHKNTGGNPPEYFVRIDASGTVTELTSINLSYVSRVADFDNDGNFYFWNPAGDNLSVFDVSAGTVNADINPSGPSFLAGDMAYRNSDGRFYGVQDSTLYIYDPLSNSVTTVGTSGKLNQDIADGLNADAFGSAWTASDGYLYTANSSSGRMYKVNLSTYETVYVGQSLANTPSDGASCAVAASPLPTTGTLGDLVWLDSNGDGIQDAGEPGLEGVTVSLYESDDTFIGSQVTDADGKYSFGSLGPSQYYLTFTGAPAGFTLSPQSAGSNTEIDSDVDPVTFKTGIIEIAAGIVDNSLDAGYRATGVGDYLWLDVDEDGIQDPAETGVSGIDVELYLQSNNSLVAQTVTNAAGLYSFTGLSATSYYIKVPSLPAGYTYSPQNQGSNDALDSDLSTSTGQSAAFTLSAYQYFRDLDVGVYQQSEPEINITGNGQDILDGDTSPSTADHTDFGSINASIDTLVNTFLVHNVTGADLTLNGDPRVAVSGTNASDFEVTLQPAETISSGNSSAFDLQFVPGGEGLRTATITISNTDADENPYEFTVRGFGLASEMQVEGNGQVIHSGDSTASVADFTDFGAQDILTGSQDRIFTILNTGNANLLLTAADPHITFTGDHPGDFSVSVEPNSTVGSNSTTNFTITFDPQAEGVRSALVTIPNNDLDENPYTFVIQGVGSATPEIEVLGNGQSIADGDQTPDVTDHTEFGSNDILVDMTTHTFQIVNPGSGTLDLTNNPIVTLDGDHAGDFLVETQPAAATVAPGDTLSFQLTFNPTAVGLRTASAHIASSDADENPFSFKIQGTGIASSELEVYGNSQLIARDDLTPSFLDSTAFDSTIIDSAFSIQFTIKNQGSALLNLTSASPYVTLGGEHAADWAVTSIPDVSVAAGGGTTDFVLTFTPSGEGLREATVTIASDDTDGPYTFAVSGYGLPTPQPELTLTEMVDLSVAAPGDTLTYTVIYANIGEGIATSVVVDEDIPENSTYVQDSATGAGMVIQFSHDNGSTYDTEQGAPVTHIKFMRTAALPPGGNGTVGFKVVVN